MLPDDRDLPECDDAKTPRALAFSRLIPPPELSWDDPEFFREAQQS